MEEKRYNLKFGKQLTLRARAGLSLLAILSIFVSDMESGDLHADGRSLRPSADLTRTGTTGLIFQGIEMNVAIFEI